MLSKLLFLSSIILTLAFQPIAVSANGIPAAVEQSNKTKKKKKSSATTAPKAAKSAASKAASKTFEGTLLYHTIEYHNAAIRNFSGGLAYNGDRLTSVTVKGGTVHIHDESMNMHTIITSDNKVYIYSSTTNEGLTAEKEFLDTYLSAFDKDVKIGQYEKTSTMTTSPTTVSHQGKNYRSYGGTLSSDVSEADVELWYDNKVKLPDNFKYVFSGLNPGGMIKRGIYCQRGSIPVIGQTKSTVAIELISVKEGPVDNSRITPPANISFSKMEKSSQLSKLYKNNKKQLKKQKAFPESKKGKEVRASIKRNWAFSDDWIDKKYTSPASAKASKELGDSFKSLLGLTTGESVDDKSDSVEINEADGVPSTNKAKEKKELERTYNEAYRRWSKELARDFELFNKANDENRNKEHEEFYKKTAIYKSAVLESQNKMRKLRKEAKKHGVIIIPHPLEYQSVNINI